jgi:hypothetical protein
MAGFTSWLVRWSRPEKSCQTPDEVSTREHTVNCKALHAQVRKPEKLLEILLAQELGIESCWLAQEIVRFSARCPCARPHPLESLRAARAIGASLSLTFGRNDLVEALLRIV